MCHCTFLFILCAPNVTLTRGDLEIKRHSHIFVTKKLVYVYFHLAMFLAFSKRCFTGVAVKGVTILRMADIL